MTRLSPDALRIIEETRNLDGPLPGDKARIRAAIDIAVATNIDIPATKAAAVASKTLALKLGVVGGVLLATAVGILVYRGMQPVEQESALEGQETVPETHVVESKPDDEQEPDGELNSPLVEAQPETKSIEDKKEVPLPKRVLTKKPKIPETSSLEEELLVLNAAQKERNKGNIQNALALLEKHRVQFPSGFLSAEREASRVLTLCAANKRSAATEVAQRFVKRYPNSPLVHTVKQSCAFETADRNEGVSTSVEGETNDAR